MCGKDTFSHIYMHHYFVDVSYKTPFWILAILYEHSMPDNKKCSYADLIVVNVW